MMLTDLKNRVLLLEDIVIPPVPFAVKRFESGGNE
jgi:hypothetical protein